jgi:hypothetical protein
VWLIISIAGPADTFKMMWTVEDEDGQQWFKRVGKGPYQAHLPKHAVRLVAIAASKS